MPEAKSNELITACAERRRVLEAHLLAQRNAAGFWEGRLSSSALSTAVALFALAQVDAAEHAERIRRGCAWLAATQTAGGGWGDTPDSPANLSTTLLVWSAAAAARDEFSAASLARAEEWLRRRIGGLGPAEIAAAILDHYGQDRTFSAPILTMLALAGRLGENPWERVPQLPFELVLLPRWSFRAVRLDVVSYALPALVAVGLARHRHRPARNPLGCGLRNAATAPGLALVAGMQPASGGFLEATPLTAFVVMCLARSELANHPIVANGVRFLVDSMREDGSWPIDTNLATWVSTLAVNALSRDALTAADKERLKSWLLGQQFRTRHPFTGAAPGGWGWTDRSGAVPDGDDTAGALLALRTLQPEPAADTRTAAAAGIRWLLGLQNRDGGIPTFCRGWGRLPFDRSCPDITAHALRAFAAWRDELPPELRQRVDRAGHAAVGFLRSSQRAGGAWVPLWFGNQAAPRQENPVYGTGRVLPGLRAAAAAWPDLAPDIGTMVARGEEWLVNAQNPDGGWGGDAGVASTVEETGVAMAALAVANGGSGSLLLAGPSRSGRSGNDVGVQGETPGPDAALVEHLRRGLAWLLAHTADPATIAASPCGLYFSSLWYSEHLYPRLFALEALARLARMEEMV